MNYWQEGSHQTKKREGGVELSARLAWALIWGAVLIVVGLFIWAVVMVRSWGI